MRLAQSGEIGPFEDHLVRLMDADPGAALAALAVLVAVAIGAAHGLAPGHGKSIAAAYLLGTRGRVRDAVGIGVVVAGMHAGSVILLGLVLYSALEGPLAIDRIVPWMTLASGLLVLVVGAALVVRQMRRRPGRGRPPDGDELDHGHHDGPEPRHGHDHSHHHPALPDGVSPLSRRGVVAIGLAGGLLPSPAAFLVLATAIFVDRILYGVALIAAFSVGLAATVALVGILVLRGRDVAVRSASRPRVRRVLAWVPLVAAFGVVAGGVWLTAVAVTSLV